MKNETFIYKHFAYIEAMERVLKEYSNVSLGELDPNTLKKIALYGIKVSNSHNSYNTFNPIEINQQVSFYKSIQKIISMLTPNEFMSVFPIKKEYLPKLLKLKDYFYTKRYLRALDMDKPLGEDTTEFLFKYHNDEILEFMMRSTEALSKQVDIIVGFRNSENDARPI